MSLSPSGRARLRVCAVAVLAVLGLSHATSAQCPSVIRVPQDAPSINAAAAQVCAGTTAEIVVAAGTWPASLATSLNSTVIVRGVSRSQTTITPAQGGRFVANSASSGGRVRFVDATLRGGASGTSNFRTSFRQCDVVECHGTFFPDGQDIEDTRFIDCGLASPGSDVRSIYAERDMQILRCEFTRCRNPLLLWGDGGPQGHIVRDCTFRTCSGNQIAIRTSCCANGANRVRVENSAFDNTLGGVGSAIVFDATQAPGAQRPRLDVVNCEFRSCGEQGSAGGVLGGAIRIGSLAENYSVAMSDTTIEGCTFLGCRASSGGAIYLRKWQPLQLISCTFMANGASGGFGGAIAQEQGGGAGSPISALACTFNSNVAGEGGAMSLSALSGAASLDSCVFEANNASSGGAIRVGGSMSVGLTACTFRQNAGGIGSSLYATGSGTSVGVSFSRVQGQWPTGDTPFPAFVVAQSASLAVGSSIFCASGVPAWSASGGATVNDLGENCVVQSCLDSNGDGIPNACDCNGDGVLDSVQVARGELADYDGSGVPDCCERGQPCLVGLYPVQWREQDGGNGHWYWVRSTVLGWQAADSLARAAGGHLVTVTSSQENEFLKRLALPSGIQRGLWSGGLKIPPPPGEVCCDALDCCWGWANGEPWTFDAWGTDEPNQAAPEDRVEILRTISRTWNDESGTTAMHWIAEWSSDCNGDGKVDYGQILSGELADSNGDGVPDECVFVPANFPTIQSAINATPAGARRSILVSPGTYVESINFLGKRVRVVGAGPGSTIIQAPPGLSASVVRALGEPAGAALEGVTVSGGQTGTAISGGVSVGGGIFADQSALSLRNCRVEGNRSGFGAGAYFRSCTGSISSSVFRANQASTDGGGLQIVLGSMLVEDTLLESNYTGSRGGGMHVVGGVHALRGVDVRSNGSANIVGGLSFVWLTSFPQPVGRLDMTDCSVTSNVALVSQGGIGILDQTPEDVKVTIRDTQVCANAPTPNIIGPWSDQGGNEICDCAADVNTDGRVDGIDLATLLSQWGPVTSTTTCDFNASGAVDATDLSFMLAAWGKCG